MTCRIHVAGQPGTERLAEATAREARRRPDTPPPSPAQTAALLHALADHTALLAALSYSREDYSPDATSVGRWLHALGDDFDDIADR